MGLDVVLQASQYVPLSYQIACAGDRSCQNENEEISLISKSPAAVFGEYIVLPVITKIANVFHAIMSRISFLPGVEEAEKLDEEGLRLNSLGLYAQALPYMQKSLEITKKILPSDHPNLAAAYNNLGITLEFLGRYPEALEYKQNALGINERVLSSDNLNLASSYSNVGVCLSRVGRHTEALEHMQKALKIHEKVLPSHDPILASSYHNMGFCFSRFGRTVEALEYQQKAAKARYESANKNGVII